MTTNQANSIVVPPYEVQNDDLYRMLSYGDSAQGYIPAPFGSWSTAPSKGAAGILTVLFQRSRGIYRLPWAEDRRLAQTPRDLSMNELAQVLTPQKMQGMIAEMGELYANTQLWLKSRQLSHVTLKRSVYDSESGAKTGAATLLARLNAAALRIGESHFQLEMDVLSSFGHGSYWRNDFSNICDFELTVQAENVAWIWHRVAHRDPRKAHSPASESGEWVIANPHPLGLVAIPAGSVTERTPTGKASTARWVNERDDDELKKFVCRPHACARAGANASKPTDPQKPWNKLTRMERFRRSLALLFSPSNDTP